MEKIKFDGGMRQYRIGGGVLRFNPADPNLYARFLECGEKIQAMEKALSEQPEDGISLMAQADRKLKELLGWVFGQHNDFDAILDGVSLLAVGENGQRVIVNLLSALTPALEEGARRCAQQEGQKARLKAQSRRETQQ